MHPELASQITRLDNVFNACSERHLEQPNLCLNDLNRIVRSYINRKCWYFLICVIFVASTRHLKIYIKRQPSVILYKILMIFHSQAQATWKCL